jgi:hypothetical protein
LCIFEITGLYHLKTLNLALLKKTMVPQKEINFDPAILAKITLGAAAFCLLVQE